MLTEKYKINENIPVKQGLSEGAGVVDLLHLNPVFIQNLLSPIPLPGHYTCSQQQRDDLIIN